MGRKDEAVKIPILEKEHYFHLKVMMKIHRLSLDIGYINCIEKGPHVPVKINTVVRLDGNEFENEEVPKSVFEFIEKNEEAVQKVKKAMNILFNSIDTDMFDNVINCTIA